MKNIKSGALNSPLLWAMLIIDALEMNNITFLRVLKMFT